MSAQPPHGAQRPEDPQRPTTVQPADPEAGHGGRIMRTGYGLPAVTASSGDGPLTAAALLIIVLLPEEADTSTDTGAIRD